MRFTAFEDESGATGTVDEVEAPRRLSFRWGDDHLTFDLTSEEGGTTFALTHSFDDRYGGPSFATGWEVCLGGLRSVLAGEPLPPPDRGIERHEALVHEFGLDAPEVTRTDGGWTVRIERQLTCPAEVAWNLWMGTDQVTGEQRSAPDVGEVLTPYMAPDVVIGTMTEVDPCRVMAFDIAPTGGPGEHLRLELTEGTGHGARIVVTVTGTRPGGVRRSGRHMGRGCGRPPRGDGRVVGAEHSRSRRVIQEPVSNAACTAEANSPIEPNSAS